MRWEEEEEEEKEEEEEEEEEETLFDKAISQLPNKFHKFQLRNCLINFRKSSLVHSADLGLRKGRVRVRAVIDRYAM